MEWAMRPRSRLVGWSLAAWGVLTEADAGPDAP
jgi:hypothetical protein